ncbi:hypothetical protein ACFQX6_51725 [Streptosporangium lutulentum]
MSSEAEPRTVEPLLKETRPAGVVPPADVTLAVRAIGPGRPDSHDEVSLVVVATTGW